MEQEDLIERDLTLNVLLPEGQERTVTFHGSKPMMDVLVILCARYHLNPSDHIIELFSMNHKMIKFMPSSLIGCLEAELIVLKPKRTDVRKAPNIPVATVRLLINYRKSHKAVVRVSPRVPLAELMLAVCEKCEMDPKTTVLMRDSQSEEPLDLTKTLDDHGIRDLYAKAFLRPPTDVAVLMYKDCKKEDLVKEQKILREKENRGFLGLFRRSKKSVVETTSSTISTTTPRTTSLALKDQLANSTGCSKASATSSTPSSETSKKRRAPPPPGLLKSQTVSRELKSSEQATRPSTVNEKQGVLIRASSNDSSLKRNKRRAPPPPHSSPSLPDTDKEKTCAESFLEDAEDDGLGQSSEFLPTCMFAPSSPLMASVLSEFTDRMKAMEQEDISPKRFVSHLPPTSTVPSLCGSLDADPVVPPGCGLLRHNSQRDGLTTFTVVPCKRPQSTRQYEFLLTMETQETINTGDKVPSPEGKSSEVEEMEKKTKEMLLEKADMEFEKIEKPSKDLGVTEVSRNDELNVEDRLPEDEDEEENDWIEAYRKRNQFISSDGGRGAKLMSRKSFVEEMVDKVPPQQQLFTCSSKDLGVTEVSRNDELKIEDCLPEDEDEEKDWIEEYRKRSQFISSNDGRGEKLMSRKAFVEEMVDEVPPQRQLSTCWEEEEPETPNQEETNEDKATNTSTIQNQSPSKCNPQRDPISDSVNADDPYWVINLSSDLQSTNSNTPTPSSSQLNSQDHPNSVQSSLLRVSKSTLDPSFKRSSPNSASLFALAVSQRVQSLGNTVCPLISSTRRINSPTPPPHRVNSQQGLPLKLYFQNLIPQEIPAFLGPCDEAKPTSIAPSSVTMTPQAKRQTWTSFSCTQLKNLEHV